MAEDDKARQFAEDAPLVITPERMQRLRQRLREIDESVFAAWFEHLDQSDGHTERVRRAHRPSSPSQSRTFGAAPAKPEAKGR